MTQMKKSDSDSVSVCECPRAISNKMVRSIECICERNVIHVTAKCSALYMVLKKISLWAFPNTITNTNTFFGTWCLFG